jgi:alkaline phosphatase
VHEFSVFDNAIGAALNKTNIEETLITVTADHSHVFGLGKAFVLNLS